MPCDGRCGISVWKVGIRRRMQGLHNTANPDITQISLMWPIAREKTKDLTTATISLKLAILCNLNVCEIRKFKLAR